MTQSIDFLQRLRPRGPWNLMALHPVTRDVECATFTDPAKAGRWIAPRNGKWNLYLAGLHPAPRTSGWKGRAVKKDVVALVGQHIDLDLDKLPTDHPWFGLSLEERAAKKVEELHAFARPGPPTVVVFTGGGLQAYWLFSEPIPITPDQTVERANEALIDLLGGDPGTWDLNRPLRLPGTTNLPNAKKLERGRKKAEARLLEFNDLRYEPWQFELAPPHPEDGEVDIDIGEPEPVEDLDALFATHHVPERVQRIVRDGPLPDQPKAFDNSHSAWVLDAACGLVRCGVPGAQIVALLLDEELGIGRDDARQAYRAVRKANKLVARDAADSFDEAERRRTAPVVDNTEKRRTARVNTKLPGEGR